MKSTEYPHRVDLSVSSNVLKNKVKPPLIACANRFKIKKDELKQESELHNVAAGA